MLRGGVFRGSTTVAPSFGVWDGWAGVVWVPPCACSRAARTSCGTFRLRLPPSRGRGRGLPAALLRRADSRPLRLAFRLRRPRDSAAYVVRIPRTPTATGLPTPAAAVGSPSAPGAAVRCGLLRRPRRTFVWYIIPMGATPSCALGLLTCNVVSLWVPPCACSRAARTSCGTFRLRLPPSRGRGRGLPAALLRRADSRPLRLAFRLRRPRDSAAYVVRIPRTPTATGLPTPAAAVGSPSAPGAAVRCGLLRRPRRHFDLGRFFPCRMPSAPSIFCGLRPLKF